MQMVITYFNSFGFENISKEIKNFICYKKMLRNIHNMQV